MKTSKKAKANTGQTAMLQEWYREVIQHSAFVFVEDTTNSEHFLTVHMSEKKGNRTASGIEALRRENLKFIDILDDDTSDKELLRPESDVLKPAPTSGGVR